jgi:hypothetical protein
MSLIVTFINRHGIVHASDSNLTNQTDSIEGKKTFEVDYLDAGLTFSGDYCINGKSADKYIDDYIQSNRASPDLTIKEFTTNLMNEIQHDIREEEIKGGIIIHIAGFISKDDLSYPTFYHISNVVLQPSGQYSSPTHEFHYSEDFLERDCPQHHILESFHLDDKCFQIYVNGFPPGRISYMNLQRTLNDTLNKIWSEPNWKFRPPCDIEETKSFVELNLNFMNVLFQSSDFNLKYVGGRTQIFSIPSPSNLAKTC